MKRNFRAIFAVCSWASLICGTICVILFFINLFTNNYLSAIYNFIAFSLFILIGSLHNREKEKIDLEILEEEIKKF
jgi:hypothetical protein